VSIGSDMHESPARGALDVSKPSGGLRHPRPWLAKRLRPDDRDASFAFGARLFATVLLTFALIGVAGYLLQQRNLEHRQIADYAAVQQADAEGFEKLGAGAADRPQAIREIDQFLKIVEQRPGTASAILVNPQHVVTAAGNDALLGTTDHAQRLATALELGTSYAGRDTDPTDDRHNFEFVTPLKILGGRYAYEVTYDHAAYDAQLNEARKLLLVIGLLALFGGGAVFYLAGGRRLMRAYRMVLRRATRDGLTDLPNLHAFQDEFPLEVAAAARYGDPLALALLDVDDFKLINDRHGHPQGDGTLKRVAAVLREARVGDRPYRIGGDEFALLLAHTDADGARTMATRLCHKLADAGVKVSVGVSGLRPGLQADALRAEADAALYEAKRHGGNGSAYFKDLGEHVTVLTTEKKEAVLGLIEDGRLTTEFQPIWNIGTETLLGVEALARPDPSYGLSGPAEAFDIAEQIGRVHQLDVLCVASALRVAPELDPDVLVFVNLSPLTLDWDADGDDWLLAAVEQAGLSPQRVVVEVTERFGGRTASVVRCLQRLREQGFKIAVDDVGTGNSGLEMLRTIEAEFVKLDRSIVSAAATEPGARAVLMAMATFARQTGALVIAEGIEDEDTLGFLRALDEQRLDPEPVIQGGQGFGLGRPSPSLPSRVPDILLAGQAVVYS
jgi:diguanylate cyclase (GGDEF)-like protein